MPAAPDTSPWWFPDRITRGPARRAWLAWLLSRTVGMVYIALFPGVADDIDVYWSWASRVHDGLVPYVDFNVEYPPGVLPLMLLPSWDVDTYRHAFFVLALLADALILFLLMRSRRPLGALLWLGAPLALGSVFYSRLDIFVALALVVAVLAIERGRWLTAGLAVTVAASFKLWPLVLVVVFVRLARSADARRYVGTVLASTAVVVAPLLAIGAGSGLRWMLDYHAERGISPESLPAVVLHVARVFGADVDVVNGHGAVEFPPDTWPALLTAANVALALALLAVAALSLSRRGPKDAAVLLLLTTTAVIVFGKVLSPQYDVWVVAAAALVLDNLPDVQLRQRLWLASMFLLVSTQYLWPVALPYLIDGEPLGYVAGGLHAVGVVLFAAVVVQVCWHRAPRR